MTARRLLAPLSVFALSALLACGGTASAPEAAAPSTPSDPPAQTVTVDVAPPSATVAPSGTVAFAATVTGTANTSVTWSLSPAGCGSVSTTGVFTAPGSAATCQIVATANADATRSAAATVTVTAPPPPPVVAVTISPTSAPLNGCGVVTFTATVTGSTNTAVTWSVQEGAAGGTITPQGVYTAPSGAGTYHVVATSVADATKTAVGTVTVTERVLSVAVSPAQITVPAGGSTQFTATVTTTCGTFTATKTVSSNGVVN